MVIDQQIEFVDGLVVFVEDIRLFIKKMDRIASKSFICIKILPGLSFKKFILHISIILTLVAIPSLWMYYTNQNGEEIFFILILNAFLSVTLFILPPIYLVVYWLIPRFLIKRKHFYFAAGAILIIHLFGLFLGYGEPLMDKYFFGITSSSNSPEVGLFAIAFVLTVTILLNLSYRWFIQQSVLKQMENDHLKKELSLLKNQINPHFFFNTLNNLYALALENSEETPDVILRLSQLMRYSIYDCRSPFVEIGKEVAYIKNYIALQQIRQYDAKIVFENEVTDETIKVAPLLFIVLLENAFKHGVDSMSQGAEVFVRLIANERIIHFEVKNNFKVNEIDQIGGVGLENVKKRLDLIYGKNHQLTTETKDDDFIATLKIQFE